MNGKMKIVIKFDPDESCYSAHILENGKEVKNVKNVLIILDARKFPIYIKNLPESWLKSLIEDGEISTFNPSKRRKKP